MKQYQVAWLADGDPDRRWRPELHPANPARRLTALRRAGERQALRPAHEPGARVAGYARLCAGETETYVREVIEAHARFLEVRLYDVFFDTSDDRDSPPAPAGLSAWSQALTAVTEGRADGILTRTTADVSRDAGTYEHLLRQLIDRGCFLSHIDGQWVR
ncbi:hypothetical protein GCM10010329_78330 [Streptomyces spiroverticillatus]|uniref:Uncharacterized protein n=1 Tax=Streptomyces finlayi TaxID=67296 RepID=A0A919CE30_9ACTN|nr:hypothetical protein [Streptomyces finlayi]GHA43742.1 hypothetical protein GCM10010329_78330 [Streptomyces spiroverticillatus]GHD13195.1 hypothetical protein GCM10010334_71020 [Streptomyces finlayi]